MKHHRLAFLVLAGFFFCFSFHSATYGQDLTPDEYLQQLLNIFPEDRPSSYHLPEDPPPHITPEDLLWTQWQKRTGELPPDFDQLPSLPFLPDPLIMDEGGQNIPVQTIGQWYKKREQIKKDAQYWLTGTFPPPPDNMVIEILEEKMIGELKERDILLRFGPDHQAQLHVTLLIPPGDNPMPVFICPWKKGRYDWVQAAVRRGYIGCRFRATDTRYGWPDDSREYEKIWWPEYDFTTLMRWAWAASRTIDYLFTLDIVEKNQIALAGLSRNGKMALWAAAYDERINAVIPISGGTGGEIPFRYTSEPYNIETIERMARVCPHWLHPRMKFFVGRENKLPVDMHSLMALVAPRGLMLTSSIFEEAGNPWGIEQAFFSAQTVYKFLGAEHLLAIDLRHGLHAPSARDMERYLDFTDFVFERGNIKPENKLYYNYSFPKWLELSKERVDPLNYPQKGIHDMLVDVHGNKIKNSTEWLGKVPAIKQHIQWILGEEAPAVAPGQQPDYMCDVVGFPELKPQINSTPLMFGRLYFPATDQGKPQKEKIPVVIYLHEYDYANGYAKGSSEIFAKSGDIITRITEAGYAVYLFDQIGFGSRIEEGQNFYERFPHWSKLGRMVADVRWAVDALSELEWVDSSRIFTAGYALGGTVGLFSAALDQRIAGVISVSGFTPMRVNTPGKTTEGIYSYSHLHGLMPRLGFFAGEESRIPVDFHEIIGCIAPRPVFLIAPVWDQYASLPDIQNCVDETKTVYKLFGDEEKLSLTTPNDYNRFSDEMKKQMIEWLTHNNKR